MAEARLYTEYKEEIISRLNDQFDYDNVMAVPKLKKIVVNCGVAEAVEDKMRWSTIVGNAAQLTAQRPVTTKAKKPSSNSKTRKGMPIGCKVTLRKKQMYEFLARLINLALPRTRDFRGVPDKSFDGSGN